jgi:hypothetical protein
MHKQSQSNIFSKVYFFLTLVRQKLVFEVYHEASVPKLVGKVESTLG